MEEFTKKYLLIQNPGEAPIEGYLLLGVSLTSGCGVEGTIGQFASGAKNAISLLLREKITPLVYCGNLRLEFGTKKIDVSDEVRSKEFAQVICRMKGKTTKGGMVNCTKYLGWTVDFGRNDWTDVNMALREFVSNSIDRTVREAADAAKRIPDLQDALDTAVAVQDYAEAAKLKKTIDDLTAISKNPEGLGFQQAIKDGRLSVEIVNEKQVRARDGFTRVYIEATSDVLKFFEELPVRFLHFSNHPEWVNQRILPKEQKLDDSQRALVYKQGVFVRQVENDSDCYGSLYDYNFDKNFRLDECRNASDYDVKREAGRCLSVSGADIIAEVFRALLEFKKPWEATFDSSQLSGKYEWSESAEVKKARKENWHKAWDKAAGGKTIMARQGTLASEQASKKGHDVANIQADTWVAAAETLDTIPTPKKVLNEHEQKGHEILPPTQAALDAVDKVWAWIETFGDTHGKEKPGVGCFRKSTECETITFGYFDPTDQKVYFEEAFANGDINENLLRTALEEVTHYVTLATDCSRDFQNFIINLAVKALM